MSQKVNGLSQECVAEDMPPPRIFHIAEAKCPVPRTLCPPLLAHTTCYIAQIILQGTAGCMNERAANRSIIKRKIKFPHSSPYPGQESAGNCRDLATGS